MAIEFLRAQVLTRGGANLRGVPAHMAYRSCSKIYDERADRTFDYTAKNSVLDSFLINAGNNTLEELANKMESAEKRKDAQVAREFILALPHELSLEINREICETFVNLMGQKYKIAAHVAIHKPDETRKDETHRKSESLKNVHAHITVTMRSVDENGNIFGPKLREMNDRKYLEGLKTQTREIINTVLKREGFSPMEMRDETQKPTQHLGPELTRMERRGTPSVKGDNNRLTEKKNQIKSELQALAKEEEVLKSGRIVVDGIVYKDFPYPKGKDYKPYNLAHKSYYELCREMGQGRLRVKERYDNKMIRSFSYQGQAITVAELALINPEFPNKALASFEQTLSEKAKIISLKDGDNHKEEEDGFKKKNGRFVFQQVGLRITAPHADRSGCANSLISDNEDKENLRSKSRRLKHKNINNHEEQRQRKAWIGTQRVKASRKPYIQQVNPNVQVAEAFWYGQQAAHAMDQSNNQGY